MIYKDRIKELREERNTKQKDIAKLLQIDVGLYSQYEIEYKIMPTKHLNKICDYFNVSLDYIFNFTNTKKYNDIPKEIDLKVSGKRLKEIRKELKLNQNQLGKILGCSFGTLSGYEIGRYVIATPFLYDICKKYNISADYLLGKIDKPIYFNIKK